MTRVERALAAFDQCVNQSDAMQAMLAELADGTEQDWIQCSQALIFRRAILICEYVLTLALNRFPVSSEIRLALAGIWMQKGELNQAELLLLALLADESDHIAARFLLARILKEQGRMSAAAMTLCELFRPGVRHDTELVIQGIEFLNDCGRQKEGADICEAAIAGGSTDPRLFAYSGVLLSQLGKFDLARTRREFVIANSSQAAEWQIPLGLADLQRYSDASHNDFALFQEQLSRNDLSEQARASLLFALGKANDDVHRFELAADYFRDANRLIQSNIGWSRKAWHRGVDSRKTRKLQAGELKAPDWVPIFIIGLPRSGSTLLAQLLARNPSVCYRGELAWMPFLIDRISSSSAHDYLKILRESAATYRSQLLQDDSTARWFIDKQPDNFKHVDLILRMFPNARFIYCVRNNRDNALSLWTQMFQRGMQEYAYDFSNIATVIRGVKRLMSHWLERFPESIMLVRYEDLVRDFSVVIGTVSKWLDLPNYDQQEAYQQTFQAISTASLWQARQPVNSQSIARWRNYAPYVPELLKIPIE